MNGTKRVMISPKFGSVTLEKYETIAKREEDSRFYIKVTVKSNEQDSYILEYEDTIVRDATFNCMTTDVLDGIITDRLYMGEDHD